MNATQDANYIPRDDEVSAPKSSSWRVASGAICKGREADGTYQTKEKIVGRLRRVGVHFGILQDGTPYGQAEADVETANGHERVKVSLTDLDGKEKGSSASLSFLWGLLQLAKDELFILTASQSKEPNKYGKHATYANFYHLAPGQSQGRPISKRPRSEEDLDTAVEKLRDELKGHPAYADRPSNESDDEHGNATTHLSAFCKECAEKGWSTPETLPGPWLALLTDFYKRPKAASSLADFTDDEWGQIRLKLQGNKDAPKAIKAAEAVKAPAAPAEDDPFASE